MAFPYIGGKSRIGKWIFQQMPEKKWDLFAEVFGGAMWLYIKNPISAKNVIYNDYSPFLYNLWTCIVFHRDEFRKHLGNVELNNKKIFHGYKAELRKMESTEKEFFIKTVPNFDIAAKYIYVLTHTFSGDFNGGMKLSENGYQPFLNKFTDIKFTEKFDAITKVENMDCEDFIEKYDGENTFFYVDPPYYGKENLYAFHNFSKEKHYSLADKLKNSKASWILSYYNYDDLKNLYPKKDYIWLEKEYTRSSSSVKDKGAKGVEVLVYPKRMKKIQNEGINLFFYES